MVFTTNIKIGKAKKGMTTVNFPYKVSGYRESRLLRSDFLGFATALC